MAKQKKKQLTHLDDQGRARMVDVAAKAATRRTAVAEATLRMKPATLKAILSGTAAKGDVLAVARIAGIQAAKKTSDLIPLCHGLALSSVSVEFAPKKPKKEGLLHVQVTASCVGPTGVEMEALCAASVAALTVYDMVKAVDRGMSIEHVRLLEKSGGRSGDWTRDRTP